jgi:hypothetical protein
MERHWEDAELLWNQVPRRFANADQFYGLAAECGLKAIMTKLENNFFNHALNRPSSGDDLCHAKGTWDRYRHYSQGWGAARYALPPIANPFAQWEIADRYSSRGHFRYTRVNNHRTAFLVVKSLVDAARRNQDLP